MNIKAKLIKLFQKKPDLIEQRLVYPDRDWHTLILSFIILIIVLSITHYLIFINLNSPSLKEDNPDTSASAKTLKKVQLERVVGVYQAQKNLFDNLMQEKPSVVDPSK